MKILYALFFVLSVICCAAQGPQRTNLFFGTHMASPSGTITYPGARSLNFGIMRVWDANTGCAGTAWEKINTADGTFNYTCMDSLVAIAATNNKQLIYTFGRTPAWATTTDAACTAYGNGTCDPPTDLTKFQTFANNMVQRYGGTSFGKVQYWECWNEPNLQRMYNGATAGNIAKLVTMCGYIRTALNTYCPACLLNSPCPTSTGDYTTGEGVSYVGGPQLFLNDFFTRSGDADILDYHNYSDPSNPLGSGKTLANDMRDSVTARAGRPIWNTEFANTPGTATYVALSFIFIAGRDEIARSIWYGWDYDTRGQWLSTSPGELTAAGWAFYQVFDWLNTATFTDVLDATSGTRCSISGTVWTCNISKPGGYTARLVWDTAGSSSYSVGSFTQFRTTANGNTRAIGGATITLPPNSLPILLQ